MTSRSCPANAYRVVHEVKTTSHKCLTDVLDTLMDD